ncbi:hypothetical protein [Adhaeribacter aquaticus]|uniref:hypothetical protein n=1 Tax=Adhaeribacter aquaticus TaxID=299567 RepID=UPI00041E4640|nr:hypothetical protein [Adhaeribacter aquaticus]
MNIHEALLQEHSKRQTTKIVAFIGTNPDRFADLMQLFFSSESRITQRAAWVVSTCAAKHPYLIDPYLNLLIANLEKPVHAAVKRNTLRLLQETEIPETLQGALANICFQFLLEDEPTAIKAFAMTVLSNLVKREPDLKNELQVILEDQLPYGSPGFVSRGRKILKELKLL